MKKMCLFLYFFAALSILVSLPGCLPKIINTNPTVSGMAYEQAALSYDRSMKAKDTFSALKYLERMIDTVTKPDLLRTHLFDRAGLLELEGRIEDATQAYINFYKRYPGDERSEIAHRKAVSCSFKNTRSATRDQQRTHKTIELAQNYLDSNQYKKSEAQEQEVRAIKTACLEKIAQSELAIIDCYLKQGRMQSAQHRMKLFAQETLDTVPQYKAELLCRQCEFTRLRFALTKDQALAQELATLIVQLQTEFPHKIAQLHPDTIAYADSSITSEINTIPIKKRSFLQRF